MLVDDKVWQHIVTFLPDRARSALACASRDSMWDVRLAARAEAIENPLDMYEVSPQEHEEVEGEMARAAMDEMTNDGGRVVTTPGII